jgi:hypothetical protein
VVGCLPGLGGQCGKQNDELGVCIATRELSCLVPSKAGELLVSTAMFSVQRLESREVCLGFGVFLFSKEFFCGAGDQSHGLAHTRQMFCHITTLPALYLFLTFEN